MKKIIVDTTVLNRDQRAAFGKMVKYVNNPSDRSVYVLRGWAGTGKTFCVSLLVNYLLSELHYNKNWYKIAVTGPTNKSVRVIRRTSDIHDTRVSFQTVHKLLGLKEKITREGKQEFVNDPGFQPKISKIKLLIIDEVSMLNDDLFEKIIKHRDKIKIICMGDPAQIPPVGKVDCIPFREDLVDEYNICTVDLKKIMRQKVDNPIIESSVAIRSELGRAKNPIELVTKLNLKGEGIEFLNLNNSEIRKGFPERLRHYFVSEDFKNNSEYAKIIAWRNKTVATMNDIIRRVIYGDEASGSKILVGEKLIANNTIIQGETVILNTNEEFTVESFIIKSHDLRYQISDYPDADPLEVTLRYYDATVSYLDDEDNVIRVNIEILHEDSEIEFKKIANIFKLRAIEKKGKDKSWLIYYKFLRKYADVNFAYAISCHKSQGSTYNTTFVLEDDIDLNWDIVERNRIKYTAYTRASRKLYVLKRF